MVIELRAVVGEYVADLVVNDRLIVDLKACKAFDDIHCAQCLNSLRATGIPVCLLVNFGLPKIKVKRFICHNGKAQMEPSTLLEAS
jgi:GxxExxY protein